MFTFRPHFGFRSGKGWIWVRLTLHVGVVGPSSQRPNPVSIVVSTDWLDVGFARLSSAAGKAFLDLDPHFKL